MYQIFVKEFPYHYGSHATQTLPNGVRVLSRFPYHYGSHATFKGEFRGVDVEIRFHTTMVLTQPKQHMRKATSYPEFPYHYGSHATCLQM